MRSGFTLLETLIALVIAALLTLVLLDSLASATGHAVRLAQLDRAQNGRVLAVIPVLRALQGAIPEYHDGEGLFVGEATQLKGLTLSGVGKGGGGVSGAPVVFAITIETDERGTWLRYFEHDQMLASIAVPEGTFIVYRGPDGQVHPAWPPAEGLEFDPVYYRPVPAAVVFRVGEIELMSAEPARDAGLTLRAVDFDLVL
jgi:prepilin-type N-terminal cleavage/methylation domain-containing protein